MCWLWLHNHLLSTSHPVRFPAAAIPNTRRRRLLAGSAQLPAHTTSWLGWTPPLPAALQPRCFSVSGVVSPGKDVGVCRRAWGVETAGNLFCSAAGKEQQLWHVGVCAGARGLCSEHGVVSGWTKITVRSYLYPRWYLPSTRSMAVMGLMIDLTVVLSAENSFCLTGCEFLYEALWSTEKKDLVLWNILCIAVIVYSC